MAYHKQEAERGTTDYCMSPSSLKEFGHCPARWFNGYNAPESNSKDWGSLFDCLALTPDQFAQRYILQPETYTNEKGEVKPWNNNATICKEWNAAVGQKEIVKRGAIEECERGIDAMMQDDVIRAWFDCCDRQVLVAGEYKSKSGLIVPVRCLLDFVPRVGSEFEKCLGDLKTCRTASVMAFQRDCFRLGYHIQAAFDLDLFSAATGQDRNTWCWLLSESYPPYQPGKRIMSQDFLTLGRASYARLLENYATCVHTGKWPGYDDTDEAVQSWSVVNAEPWMATHEQFAPRYEFGSEPEDSEAPEENIDLIP